MKEAEKILKIPVVRFKYRDGYLCKDDELYGKTIPGFYAENINKVLPNVVMHDENGVPEDWNYRILVPLMVKMIQGMAQRIEVLERRVS